MDGDTVKVVYEGAIFEILPLGGVARYFSDLIQHLPESIDPTLLSPDHLDPGKSAVATSIEDSRLKIESIHTKPPLKMLGRFWRPRQHQAIGKRIDSLGADILHWTYYTGLCRRSIAKQCETNPSLPNVVTVLDFMHESFPELDPSGKHSEWKRQAIEQADHVCCISQATHDILCQRHPSAATKASVTVLGNTFANVKTEQLDPRLTDRPYLLFVGRRHHYKNFGTFWRAWLKIRENAQDVSVVLVGSPISQDEQREFNIDPSDPRLFVMSHVGDGQLRSLYENSLAFVFPSKEEGFGLPALEAMESGTAVISSRCAALSEVLGEVGYYFDGDDVNALADLMLASATEQLGDREEKVMRGRERAKLFSWENTARATAEAYQRVIDERTAVIRAA